MADFAFDEDSRVVAAGSEGDPARSELDAGRRG
jgi:hypothetical protein